MSMIFNGTNRLQFPDSTMQSKGIADAVATALNSSTYNANKVNGFPLSVIYEYGQTGTIDANALTDSFFYTAGDLAYQTITFTNFPVTITTGGFGMICGKVGSAYVFQIFVQYNNYDIYFRYRYYFNGYAWSEWKKIWNSASDGNGGTAPAPKQFRQQFNLATGATKTYTLPASLGLWLVEAVNNSATNASNVQIIGYSYGGHGVCATLATASNCAITLSGADVIITNTRGADSSLSATISRIGWA